MLCIQVPISEMSCPLKKSWKLRWRNARKVAGNPILRAAEPFRSCSSEFAVLSGLLKAGSFYSFLGCRRSISRFNPALVTLYLPRDSFSMTNLGLPRCCKTKVESGVWNRLPV